MIIDSIQTIASDDLESVAGSVSQVRECASRLLKYAKESSVPIMLIGHITKDGNLAGPKVLEHIVDAVLHFEGDGQHIYRLLRAIKNRFGSTSELGIYEMCQRGRSVNGFDSKRMNMLLAVLEKRAGFKLAAKDVFLNIAGGLKVNDPALDLAVICSVLSSNIDIPIPHTTCITGEVGLSGEIRPVGRIEQRIREAEKLGMDTILIPRGNLKGIDTSSFSIRIIEIAKVEEALRTLFA